jgi:hypothetical protein
MVDGFPDRVRVKSPNSWKPQKKDAFNTAVEPEIVADFIVARNPLTSHCPRGFPDEGAIRFPISSY